MSEKKNDLKTREKKERYKYLLKRKREDTAEKVMKNEVVVDINTNKNTWNKILRNESWRTGDPWKDWNYPTHITA